jgi:hypothetical protein
MTEGRNYPYHFVPDRTFFSNLDELSAYAVLGHLRTVAALAPHIRAQFCDERMRMVSDLNYHEGHSELSDRAGL